MLIRNTKTVSVDEVYGYIIKGVDIHPLLYIAFLRALLELEYEHKLCLTPQTRLELYSARVSANIARKLAA